MARHFLDPCYPCRLWFDFRRHWHSGCTQSFCSAKSTIPLQSERVCAKLKAGEKARCVMFRDRADAGRRLAAKLKDKQLHDPVVLGIPRGGVAIGAVLADELDADLDIVLSRKLRAPEQPELAIGALSETGEIHLND